ncbi:MAG: hypothetical protein K9I95_06955, partial [Flavobacteriaceae bacterium]|nr:hypothetical protein [Flavobacteriaceae bacterium]
MKKLYAKKTYANNKSIKLMLFAVLLISTIYHSIAQVRVPFTPRTSDSPGSPTVYTVKGDFTMMGNTNLTLVNYSNTSSNNADMQYVDIDGDANTWNSSSSTLTFSTENGAIPDCSNIIYAGLYWTGRAYGDNETDSNIFQVTKNVPTGAFTTQQVTNTDIDIRDNDAIPNTNYSLDIGNNNPIIFTFTSSGLGDSVRFRYNSNSSIEVSRNNGSGWDSYTSISGNYNNNYFIFDTPYQIFSDSNYTLNVTRLRTNNTDRAFVNVTYNETVAVTTQATKVFDKRVISIKGPTSSTYTQYTADANDIYYPSGTDGNMYSAYKEITSYVQQNGLGEYFVADIALREGNSDATGYYGGWGMVVVYENSKMNYRNVTVFDGHAYVPSATTSFVIDASGFNTVQSGNVNIKLGLMAGEGDNQWTGDYFEIQRQVDNNYQRLNHSTNTTGNFFNSSINTGGNTRNPNLQNNTGLDIAMFNINNTNNDIITNNQTSTRFRYGSTQDTYCIFNVTFSVDAYIPEVDGILTTTSTSATPPLAPNESADYTIEIRNKGTEATDNTVITIPIPDNVNPYDLNITSNVYAPLSTTNTPIYNPSIGVNGSIVWDLGTLPLPSDSNTVLADISFTLTVTTNCSILENPSFNPNISLNGTISGVGAISNIPFSNFLVQGYQTSGLCIGEPIPAPSQIAINYLDYINQPPTASNPAPINIQCNESIPVPDISVVTDATDNSGIAPTIIWLSDVSDNNTCPETITRTYRVSDNCNKYVDVFQEIIINVPDFTLPANGASTVNCLVDAQVAPTAPAVNDACGNAITPVLTTTPSDIACS